MLRVLRLNFEAASGVGLSDSESESTCLTLSESPRRSSWGTPKAASGIHWLSGRADSDADSGSEDPPGPISASGAVTPGAGSGVIHCHSDSEARRSPSVHESAAASG